MSSSRNPSRAGAARTAGFTLIELIIGLVISGILAGVMFQLFQGQGRFVAAQGAREEALQNGRGALDLIATELRAARPEGLSETESGSIAFVLPRIWGVMCSSSATQMTVAFPKVPDAAYGIPANPASGGPLAPNTLVQIQNAAGAWSEYAVTYWNPKTATDCASLNTVDTNTRVLQFTGSGLPSPTPPAGTVVALGERVRYDVATVANLGGDRWIRRSVSWTGSTPTSADMQPLGGPVPAGAESLVFRYYIGNAATPVASISDVSQRQQVTRIEMRVVTQSREKVGTQKYQRSTDTLMVHLRNRG